MKTTDNRASSTPDAAPAILVPQAPLWLLSFAADGHPLSFAFGLLSDGFSFDDAWLRARAAATVPPGHWDVTGWEVPEAKRLELLALDPDGLIGELVPGQRLNEEQACRFFGPRTVWDWRAVDGPRRRALLASQARAEAVREEAETDGVVCEHDTTNTESCLVAHQGRGPCLMCRTCFRWVRWEEQLEQRRPATADLLRV